MFMKTRAIHLWQALFAAAFAFLPASVSLASDTSTTAQQVVVAPATPATPAAAEQKLPYGADDILKLSRAHIGEEIILNYIRNSGTIYNLRPADIVYLKNAGVSEKVINAMVDQRKQVELAAAQTAQMAAQAPAPTPVVNTAPTGPSETYDTSTPGTEMSATPAEAPLTPPASTVTTIPYPAATSAYYGYYYPYYPYYGYYPGVSFAFGFGPGCYYGHGYYGHGYYGHSYAVHGGGGHVSHSGGHGGGHH